VVTSYQVLKVLRQPRSHHVLNLTTTEYCIVSGLVGKTSDGQKLGNR